jgi:2-methylisocitrate lyase-like PEP mutase family enzyme
LTAQYLTGGILQRPSIASVLQTERPLVTPLAHDALSVRLISRAGFRAFTIGGSALLASRYALPDIGLIGLSDMTAGIRDIAAATSLPFFADGDDGYGDVKSVARMIEQYEQIGVGAILIEDQQREHKQQRADRALGVVDRAVIEGKLRIALAERRNPDTFVIGRTDALGLLGLDEALRRAERFLKLGCDGIFIAGLKTMPDYERVGRELRGARLSAAIFESSGMPWPTPAELGALGFSHISYPASLLFRIASTMHSTLASLRRHATGAESMMPDPGADAARGVLDDALDLARWQAIESDAKRASGETEIGR